MSNDILTLEQIQRMSAEDITNAYNNGYRLSEKTDIHSSSPITESDINIIVFSNVVSNLITIAILGGIIWIIVRRERKKFVAELKEITTSTVEKLEKLPILLKALETIRK